MVRIKFIDGPYGGRIKEGTIIDDVLVLEDGSQIDLEFGIVLEPGVADVRPIAYGEAEIILEPIMEKDGSLGSTFSIPIEEFY